MSIFKPKTWELIKEALEWHAIVNSLGGGAWVTNILYWMEYNFISAFLAGIFFVITFVAWKIYRQHYKPLSTGLVAKRSEIERTYPLETQLIQQHSIKACFLTGLDVFQRYGEVLKSDRIIEKLMLPNPSCGFLKDLQNSHGDLSPSFDHALDIKKVSKMAIERKISVRWYPHFYGFSFLIGSEKNSGKQWAHIETVLPYITPPNRLIIRLENNSEPETIDELSNTFDEMWRYCGHDITAAELT